MTKQEGRRRREKFIHRNIPMFLDQASKTPQLAFARIRDIQCPLYCRQAGYFLQHSLGRQILYYSLVEQVVGSFLGTEGCVQETASECCHDGAATCCLLPDVSLRPKWQEQSGRLVLATLIKFLLYRSSSSDRI